MITLRFSQCTKLMLDPIALEAGRNEVLEETIVAMSINSYARDQTVDKSLSTLTPPTKGK